jgi:hypothetical protein
MRSAYDLIHPTSGSNFARWCDGTLIVRVKVSASIAEVMSRASSDGLQCLSLVALGQVPTVSS